MSKQVLEKNIFEFLKDNGIEISLMGYKEMETSDGYYMQGYIKINNKKSIFCEDQGFGGGLNYHSLNENGQVLINLIKEYENLLKEKELKYIKKDIPFNEKEKILNEHGYSFYDFQMDIEKVFSILATIHLNLKQAKKNYKNFHLIAFDIDEYNFPNEYFQYKKTFSLEAIANHLRNAENKYNIYYFNGNNWENYDKII